MLYIFHGTNSAAVVTKATSLVNSLRAKKTDASYVRIEAGNWTPSVIEEHLGGQGLFSNKYIIFLDRITENADAKEILVGFIAAMHESPNIFIVLEGKLNVELKKAFEENAEKMVEVEKSKSLKVEKSEEFNIFSLADAVGSRDSFKSWSLYRQAIDNGIEPENIVGTLFWQLKSMALAVNAKSAGEAGVSPFVFSKARRAAGNYSAQELAMLTEDLITIYHDGHRGKVDMELGIEKALLSISKF